DRADDVDRGPNDQAGRVRPRLVWDFCRSRGGNGRSIASGRVQSVRAADHERKGFQHRGARIAAIFLSACRSRGYHYGISRYRDGAATFGVLRVSDKEVVL